MDSPVDPYPPDPSLSGDHYSLAHLASLWFLGLAGIYLVYGVTVFLRLGDDVAFLERVEMVLGPTTIAFALLISPSVFAAGLGQVNGPSRDPGRPPIRRRTVIALFAGIALLLSSVGPMIVASLASSFSERTPEMAAASRPQALELARLVIPLAISAFVLLSGLAGILIGRVTNRWQPPWRSTARWVSGVALMASFLFPFLATTDATAQHGTSPIWIILNPLAIPLLLTSVLALRERDALGFRLGSWWRRINPTALNPESVDRIITSVTGDPDSPVDPRGLTQPEREMATLATAIRRIAAPRAVVSESRAREIVAAVVEASPAKTPEESRPRRSWFEPSVLGGFCTSWTCLAAGLLIVSPLGGVPVSVVSAAVVGFLGSAGIVLVARRFPELAATVPT